MDSNTITTPIDEDGRPFSLAIEVVPPDYQQTAIMNAEGKRKRVGFTSDTTPPSPDPEAMEQSHYENTVYSPEGAIAEPSSGQHVRGESSNINAIPDIPEDTRREFFEAFGAQTQYAPKAKPAKAVLRRSHHQPDTELQNVTTADLEPEARERHQSSRDAHERASRLAAKVGSYQASAAPSRSGSVDLTNDEETSVLKKPKRADKKNGKTGDDSDEEDLYRRPRGGSIADAHAEANRLVRTFTQHHALSSYDSDDSPLHSGQITPMNEIRHTEEYVPRPAKYRGGIVGSLMKLQRLGHESDGPYLYPGSRYSQPFSQSLDELQVDGAGDVYTPGQSPPISGTSTPTGKTRRFRPKWAHSRHGSSSPHSVAALIGSTANLAMPNRTVGEETVERVRQYKRRPDMGVRSKSSDALHNAWKKLHSSHDKQKYQLKKHLAETLARQRYILKLCRALMEFGAPTHRLEEYLKMTSRVLCIEAQFLYLPGCMLVSFDDSTTHTAEVKLVRTLQGVDLGKLRDTHQLMKEVVHEQTTVPAAIERLDIVMTRPAKFPVWTRVLMFGIAALSVGPFAFQANYRDLPVAFLLGCLVGTLQLKISPRSDLYANVFEIVAAVVTSFIARGLGSIRYGDGYLFCFSALAQSSIALILPGYTILCASLELQSRSIIAGSVRMVYAIIYSLFLGYGITIGTVLYGWIQPGAVSATTCAKPMEDYWFFFFVPVFTMALIIVNQGKWKQAPVMLFIAFSGYLVSFFLGRRFPGNAQISQSLAALAIGVEANLYARLGPKCDNFFGQLWLDKLRPHFLTSRQKLQEQASTTLRKLSSAESGTHESTSSAEREKADAALIPTKPWLERKGYGMAAAAMLPAIFVQVPSGLAVSGSLVAGIASADEITSNVNGTTTANSGANTFALGSTGAAFGVSLSVIQIAIGITVGLFMSAVIVYPAGKRRSGLFSF